MIPNIGLFDYCLSLIYLVPIFYLAIKWKKGRAQEKSAKWFIPALTIKILGAFSFALISIHYYQKGDTFLYFEIAENLRQQLLDDFSGTMKILFTSYDQLIELKDNPLEPYNYYYERASTWNFSRMLLFFNVLAGGSYWVCTLLFTLVSFIGLWLGFEAITRKYKNSNGLHFIAFFGVPSALIWTSGILKDTLIIGMFGLFLYACLQLIYFKRNRVVSVIILVGTCTLLVLLRSYFIYFLLPTLLIWAVVYSFNKIVKRTYRLMLRLGAFLMILMLIVFGATSSSSTMGKYSVDRIFQTLKGFHSYHTMYTDLKDESTYTLGDMEYSFKGVLKKTIPAMNVTFFRPYPWEIRNAPLFLGGLEVFLFVLLTLYFIFRFNRHLLSVMIGNKELMPFLFFSLSYGCAVGLTAYNFGALSRYKAPAFLLVLVSFAIILSEVKRQYGLTFFPPKKIATTNRD